MNNLLPLFCLPSADYFSFILKRESLEISIGERYVKQSRRNRFYIMGPNNILKLSIPVTNEHQAISISEVKIDYSENCLTKHWRGIEASYRNSPYFEHYFDDFYRLFTAKHFLLAEFNIEALKIIFKILKWDKKLILNTRPTIVTASIPEIEKPKTYNQVFAERYGFVKNLSIIDIIFNNGPFSNEILRG